MHHRSNDIHFEEILRCCTNLSELCNVIDKSKEKRSNVLWECMSPWVNLIKQAFNELTLKEQNFQVYEPASHAEIQEMFKNISLDDTLNPKSAATDLAKLPKLAKLSDALLQRKKLIFFRHEVWGFELVDMSSASPA